MDDLVKLLSGIHSNIRSKRTLSPAKQSTISNKQDESKAPAASKAGAPTLLGQLEDDQEKERYAYELCSKILSKGNQSASAIGGFSEEININLRNLNNAQYKLQLQASESV